MELRWWGLCLVSVVASAVSFLSEVARAELPPPPCYAGWWTRTSELPTTVMELPSRPTVLVPVQWADKFDIHPLEGPSSADLDAERLLVEVRDPYGTLVPGTVSLQAPTHPNETIFPKWKAAQDLVAGDRYTMTVRVGAAPPDYHYTACPWPGFESQLEFTIQTAPLEAAIEVTKLVTRELRTPLRMGVCDSDEQTRCAAFPWICCPTHEDARGLTATVDLPTPPPNGHLYYDVRVEFISPYFRGGGFVVGHAMHEEYPAQYATFSVSTLGPVKPDEECARATLLDRFDGTVIAASQWHCALPEDHIAVVLDGFCDPQMCAMMAPNIPEPSPVEPGPEVEAEPGPEASPEDIAEEVADPSPELEAESDSHVAEPDDAQAGDADPANGGSRPDSGCGGGPDATLYGLVGLLCLVPRRRPETNRGGRARTPRRLETPDRDRVAPAE